MPIDDRSPNRNYQLPNIGNFLSEDIIRLRDALNAIDVDVNSRYTKAETEQLITDLVNGSPSTLNTLNELAAALGNDPNFAATIASQLGLKANSADVYTRAQSDARFVQGQTQAEMVFIASANQSEFPLSTPVINKPSALVSVDGVIQPTSAYSLNMTGTQLTLSESVPLGTIVRVLAMGVASQGAPADDTVTTAKVRDQAITMAKLAFDGGSLSGNRNRLINGGMQIDQRDNGAVHTFTANAGGGYCVDRWVGYCEGANVTGRQVQASAGLNRYQFTGAAGVTRISLDQRIEAANCADMAGGYATFSVDLANSLLSQVGFEIEYANSINDFSSRTLFASNVFSVTSVASRYSIGFAIPAEGANGILVRVGVGAQTSGTFTVGNAQLESGAVPTPFERRPIGVELALCQRYYYKTDRNFFLQSFCNGSNANTYAHVNHPVTMRVAPAPSSNFASGFNNQSQIVTTSPQGFTLKLVSISSGDYAVTYTAGNIMSSEL